jgi:hypothetical protein
MSAIPASAAPFFQEYHFEELTPEGQPGLVIERILAFGNRPELRWLFEQYGAPAIRQWLVESGAHRLPRLRYNLFCCLLDVSPVKSLSPIWPH